MILPDTYKKKGLSYLDSVEHTLLFLLDLKGRYTRKRIHWHCRDMLSKIRNARTLINKAPKKSEIEKISDLILNGD